MNLELTNIISNERTRYFNHFIESTNSLFISNQSKNPAIELLIQINDEYEMPFNLIRLDFISKNSENEYNISQILLDTLHKYDQKNFVINETKIIIKPFWWSNCEFLVDKLEKNILSNWVTKHLKIDDEFGAKEISEAIHSSTNPILNNKYSEFTIDFGTSPDKIFLDFIELLSQNGAKEIIIQTQNSFSD
jgi:hypothetical protein